MEMRKNNREVCEHCGERLEPWQSFCTICGTQLVDPPLTREEVLAIGHRPEVRIKKAVGRDGTSVNG